MIQQLLIKLTTINRFLTSRTNWTLTKPRTLTRLLSQLNPRKMITIVTFLSTAFLVRQSTIELWLELARSLLMILSRIKMMVWFTGMIIQVVVLTHLWRVRELTNLVLQLAKSPCGAMTGDQTLWILTREMFRIVTCLPQLHRCRGSQKESIKFSLQMNSIRKELLQSDSLLEADQESSLLMMRFRGRILRD